MAQSFTQIQQALDTQLLTVNGITNGTTGNLISENQTMNLSSIPNFTTRTFVRSTLVPSTTTVETLGNAGYVKVNGLYAIDVIGPMDKGYLTVKPLADLVLAAFPRGLKLTLTNGDVITVAVASPSPNVAQGSWAMNKLYCVQVVVQFFGYVQP